MRRLNWMAPTLFLFGCLLPACKNLTSSNGQFAGLSGTPVSNNLAVTQIPTSAASPSPKPSPIPSATPSPTPSPSPSPSPIPSPIQCTSSILDQFQLTPYTSVSQSAYQVAIGSVRDKSNNLYVAGTAYYAPNGTLRWYVRKSADDGKTWSTIDDGSSLSNAVPNQILISQNDNIIVVGNIETASGMGVVRTSADGGASWVTLPNYQIVSGLYDITYMSNCNLDSDNNLVCMAQMGPIAAYAVQYKNAAYVQQTVKFDFMAGQWSVVKEQLGMNQYALFPQYSLVLASTPDGRSFRLFTNATSDSTTGVSTGTETLQMSPDSGATWTDLRTDSFNASRIQPVISVFTDQNDVYVALTVQNVDSNNLVTEVDFEIDKLGEGNHLVPVFHQTDLMPQGHGLVANEVFSPIKLIRSGEKLTLVGYGAASIKFEALVSTNQGMNWSQTAIAVNGQSNKLPYQLTLMPDPDLGFLLLGSIPQSAKAQNPITGTVGQMPIWDVESLKCAF